ncbi:MAG: polyphenol oxidase family protein [Thermoanaerobaculia bacterium]|nr:polyphenol oxidase family protein [Thermoanaerobaculia bacterium]MCZ7652807.1 polyphenol oxidase family protein [Thermoanaerobaculia bacterium]
MPLPPSPPRPLELDPQALWRPSPGHWSDRAAGVRVGFAGRALTGKVATALARVEGPPVAAAWLRQLHGAAVVEARAGACGEGDALVSGERDLALAVVTADCVPVLVAAGGRIAAVHAGWRGIVAGVVPAALARLPGAAAERVAWLGPAIGPCCFEVEERVADEIAAATSGAVIVPRADGRRPHVDLWRAVCEQLVDGVGEIRRLGLCTRCAAAGLHSYRRDGARAGRNLSWIVRGA